MIRFATLSSQYAGGAAAAGDAAAAGMQLSFGDLDMQLAGLLGGQVRFCRDRVFPYRRLMAQGGQGRGSLGYRFTV
jgi:hypothetical protein